MFLRVLKKIKKRLEIAKVNYKSIKKHKGKNNIIFWAMGGMLPIFMVESLLAKSLETRGYNVNMIICDGTLPACIKSDCYQEWKSDIERKENCYNCKKGFVDILDKLKLKYVCLGEIVAFDIDYIMALDEVLGMKDIEKNKFKGIDIGKDIKASIVRYMQGRDYYEIDDKIKNAYIKAAFMVLNASEQVFRKFNPDIIVMSHGIYADWGPALKNFLYSGIKVITWCSAYDKCKFFIANVNEENNADPHLFGDEKNLGGRLKKDVVDKAIDKIFYERYFLKNSFDMKENNKFCKKQTNYIKPYFKNNKPIWGIFTHINWDAPENFIPMLYSSFNEWIVDTINTLKEDKVNNFIIRIHPAEKWCNRDGTGVEEYIKLKIGELPEHMKIVGKNEIVDSLDIYRIINGGITVFGTPGIELSMLGKPVILAGKPSYAQRGFTLDSHSKEEYRERLKNIEQYQLLDETKVELAKKVAYVYFIKKQVPIYMLYNKNSQWWDIQFDKLSNILPGKDPIIDFICEQIIDGGDFVLSEELVELSEDENYKRKYGVM